MQYPGTTQPFGGFAGAHMLTNQLTPNSLAARKQQLVNHLVTGQDQRKLAPGNVGGIGGHPVNNLLDPFFSFAFSHGGDPGPFYGPGGQPEPPSGGYTPPPVSGGVPSNPLPGVTSSPSTPGGAVLAASQAIGPPTPAASNPNTAALITLYHTLYGSGPQVMNPGMRLNG